MVSSGVLGQKYSTFTFIGAFELPHFPKATVLRTLPTYELNTTVRGHGHILNNSAEFDSQH
jgi:hypothetical protein